MLGPYLSLGNKTSAKAHLAPEQFVGSAHDAHAQYETDDEQTRSPHSD